MDNQVAPTTRIRGLAALETRLAQDLSCLNYPPANWVIPTTGPGGAR